MTVGNHVDLRAADLVTVTEKFEGYVLTCEKSTIETSMGKVRTYTMWKSKIDLLSSTLYVHVWDGVISSSSIL